MHFWKNWWIRPFSSAVTKSTDDKREAFWSQRFLEKVKATTGSLSFFFRWSSSAMSRFLSCAAPQPIWQSSRDYQLFFNMAVQMIQQQLFHTFRSRSSPCRTLNWRRRSFPFCWRTSSVSRLRICLLLWFFRFHGRHIPKENEQNYTRTLFSYKIVLDPLRKSGQLRNMCL